MTPVWCKGQNVKVGRTGHCGVQIPTLAHGKTGSLSGRFDSSLATIKRRGMTLEQQLIKKLESNEALRANDRLLILDIWKDEGLELTPHQQQRFMEVSSPESVRRSRQKIQEKGLCLPSQQVQRLRRKRSIQVRDAVRESKTPILQTFLDVPQSKQDIWSTL